MKRCSKCKIEKELTEFGKRKRNPNGLRYQCKVCESDYQKVYYEANGDERREYINTYYYENKEDLLAKRKADRKANPEKYSEFGRLDSIKRAKEKAANTKRWREENPDKHSAYFAAYRTGKEQATPDWLTEDDYQKIKIIYNYRDWLIKTLGEPHEVDHILPLKGRTVCGLHVPWNLQILEASENRKKSNKL